MNLNLKMTLEGSKRRSYFLSHVFIPNDIDEKISPFWLVKSSAVFFENSAEESQFSAKRRNKPSILIGQWSKKLTDGQSNLLFSNEAYALDGAIDGVIFPWLRDTSAFLLFYHFEIFSCILLISNHMTFLVQFGINKHLQIFQRPQIALALQARAILLVWKIYWCLFIPNCTEIMWLPIQKRKEIIIFFHWKVYHSEQLQTW